MPLALDTIQDTQRDWHVARRQLPEFAADWLLATEQSRVRTQIEQAAAHDCPLDRTWGPGPTAFAFFAALQRSIDKHGRRTWASWWARGVGHGWQG